MLVTLLGIVTEVKREQAEKAPFSMLVTLLGIVTEVKPGQPEKAYLPMLVTLLGIVTEVKAEQLSKAKSPMLVTLLGIIVVLHPECSVFVAVSIIALQLFRESYTGFPSSTTIEVKPLL